MCKYVGWKRTVNLIIAQDQSQFFSIGTLELVQDYRGM